MEKILLSHPAGKKAVSMDSDKYELLSKAITDHLKNSGEDTHKSMFTAIAQKFQRENIEFSGSIEWHMEWVKLDLEAKGIIKRKDDKSPIKLMLA